MEQQNPYQSPQSAVADVAGEGELAGRGTRLGAVILDAIILLAITLPVMYFGGYFAAVEANTAAGNIFMPLGTQLMWAAAGFVIFVLVQYLPLKASGQTWGKRITGIRIVDLDGNQPDMMQLLGKRYFPMHLISNIPVLGGLIALVNALMIFRADRRCLHDLIAGTRVVKAR